MSEENREDQIMESADLPTTAEDSSDESDVGQDNSETTGSNSDSTEPSDTGEAEFVEPEALTSEQMVAALNAQDYKGSELMDVLAQMEALISQARSLPMSSSVLVNKAQALSLLESAREAMPTDIRIANQIVAGANAVIARAQEEAETALAQANSTSERIQADAHARADELVNQERIVVMAKERAEMIIETATRQATDLAAGADRYCEEKLTELEGTLDKLKEQSAAGRRVLSERARFNPDDLPQPESENPEAKHD
ncbi:hypothetical protein [uncultured Mobiluncus sp.]|uniref:hypothetical protein n=1 Tax=uncultured Mobiluncus sp. TaxID=293425 RepID=UPI002806247C|nr:hypothetical protein [uncultured Mobiluncus sp.]